MLSFFHFVPQQVLFFFKFHFVKLIVSKSRKVGLVSKSIYFSRDSLCFVYFDVISTNGWKKSWSQLNLFLVVQMSLKNVVLCNNWYWASSVILSYGRATFKFLMDTCLYSTRFSHPFNESRLSRIVETHTNVLLVKTYFIYNINCLFSVVPKVTEQVYLSDMFWKRIY